MQARRASVVSSTLWMVGITLVLFFLPGVNGLIGGAVGGYKAGTVGRGLTAAVLPAIAAALGLWALLGALDLPVFGFFAGIATGIIVLLADVGMFIGAAIGGAISGRRPRALTA